MKNKKIPKLIGLARDGSYKIFTEEELREHEEYFDYFYGVLIYIGDDKKGPHYIFKYINNLVLDHLPIDFTLRLRYSYNDVLYGEYTKDEIGGIMLSDFMNISSIHEAYSIQSLILQCFSMITWMEMTYNETALWGLPYIDQYCLSYQRREDSTIKDFSIMDEYFPSTIKEFSIADEYLPVGKSYDYSNLFEDLKISVDTNNAFYEHIKQFILFNKEKYVFHENRTRYSDDNFLAELFEKYKIKYVAIPILDFNTVFLLTEEQINKLRNLGSITVYFITEFDDTATHVTDYEFEQIDTYPSFFTSGGITDIIKFIAYTINMIDCINLLLTEVNGTSDLELSIILQVRGIAKDIRIDVIRDEIKDLKLWSLIINKILV